MADEDRLGDLERRLGYAFRDRSLLVQALSHASYVNEASDPPTGSNERMEFLGDSVLGLVVTRYLYDHYPDCPEGEMTLMKSVLVSEETLARVARTVDLGSFLLLGKGEAASGGRERRQPCARWESFRWIRTRSSARPRSWTGRVISWRRRESLTVIGARWSASSRASIRPRT
jgi:dsRNA-specific ribonuclease